MIVKKADFHNRLIKISALLFLMTASVSCAIQQAPGGGPKDEKPPQFIGSEPGINTVNFSGKKIMLTFNEYVKLKNIEKFLLISPPLNQQPDIREAGKSLQIKIKDTLRDNTTYKFYLGDAIVDITEGNAVRNFSYAFSTGPVIDSLTLQGKVTGAGDLEPKKDVFVMLYRSTADSAPMLDRPDYVTRTYDNGDFVFTNLAAGKYRIVSIKDLNGDYMYSPGTEEIAFDDSLAEPEYAVIAGQDSVGRIALSGGLKKPLELRLFTEPDSAQRILKSNMITQNQLQLVFRYPTRNLQLIPLGADNQRRWDFREFSSHNDTVQCWLIPPVSDTLRLQVIDNGNKPDTITLATAVKSKESGRGKNTPQRETLSFVSSVSQSRILELNRPFFITASSPLVSLDTSLILIINAAAHDTAKPQSAVRVDSIGRNIIIRHPWAEGNDYQILLPKGAATDIYNQTNDSLTFAFKVRTKEEYGLIRIRLDGEKRTEPLIFQLLNEKGIVVAEKKDVTGNLLVFDYLLPGKYRMRAIADANRNGKWDSGLYLKHQQPELTFLLPKVLEVRSNWELEESWTF